MTVTQKDIAEKLNISRALVGQVLSDRPDVRVSAETRRRIMQAAREMQYRPHLAARGMKTQKSLQVGVLVQNVPEHPHVHPLAWEFITGINKGLAEGGYTMALIRLTDVAQDGGLTAPIFQGHFLDGLIVVNAIPSELEAPVEALTPHCVWLDANIWRPQGCLRRDEVQAGYTAGMALAARGCREWVFLRRSAPNHFSSQDRWEGACRAARESGILLRELVIPYADESREIQAVLPWLRPEIGVISGDFYTAQTLLYAAVPHGLRPGLDFALACCDEGFHGPGEWAHLSRVSFDRLVLGFRAAQMMLGALRTAQMPPSEMIRGEWLPGATVSPAVL